MAIPIVAKLPTVWKTITTSNTAKNRKGKSSMKTTVVFAAVGLTIWFLVPYFTGHPEAWDSPWYWLFSSLAGFAAGVASPRKWSLCAFAVLLAQAIGFSIQYALGPGGPFGPLVGLMTFVWLLPFVLLLAWLGSKIRGLGHRFRTPLALIFAPLVFVPVAQAQMTTQFRSGAMATSQTEGDIVVTTLTVAGEAVLKARTQAGVTTYVFLNRGYENLTVSLPESEVYNVQLGMNFLWQMSEHAREHTTTDFNREGPGQDRVEIDYCSYSPEGWWPECWCSP
jgi:hypothetical protein